MDVCVTPRRHNPVDSICRKLQTIQRWDRKADSPFQIPKLQSSSYDSPHLGLRCNLETILKKRTLRSENDPHPDAGPALPGAVAPAGSPAPRPPTHPGTPAMPATPANATYTITSTLGSLAERHGTGAGQSRAWQRTCSTPAAQGGEGYFTFARYPGHSQPDGGGTDSQQPRNPSHSLLSYNLKFCSTNSTTLLDTELAYPALVVKRLSMGDGGVFPSEPKKESMAEVSLICEEDLLDTIFQACDTQRRGKVYVSRIVDYLRHTTSRSSEDSGLEELCNMLDPEHKDISIDLDTYHAIMKEWIDDCRKQREDVQEDSIQGSVKRHDSLSAKRSALLSMTSGSLEAFGGEASRADLETSDLVYCVADLQFSNQKLQEEVRKLKQAVDTMEEINQRLLEENEELKTQAKVAQQLAQREKLLKEEVEEMKLSLSNLAESQALATSQSKQMERENQGLITKIACLQEESIKSAMEVDDFQRRMIELCDLNTDLQVQAHSFDTVIAEKQGVIQEKNRQIEELKAAIMEYSSVTERLRADKTRLESQMQLLHPDSTLAGLSLSVAYRLNQTSSGSLQTELALAQSPLEGPERLSYVTSPLDETLDREVLLLLQGPMPEQMAQEFKTRLHRLRTEFQEDTLAVLAALRGLLSTPGGPEGSMEPALQDLQARLEQGRGEWAHSLERMEQYTDSLEKELLKMASNMRRAHTDILHLSVRVQEQENHRQQLYEELERLKTPQDSREASCQTPDSQHQALGELDAPSLDWDDGCITSRLEQEPEVKLQSGLSTGVEEVREHQEQTPDWLKEDADPSLIADRVVEGRSSDGVISQEDSGVWKEDIGGDSTLSQESLPDRNPHHEAADAGVVRVEKPTENDRIPLEDSRLPGCTAAQAAHEHAVQGGGSQPSPHPHAHTLCADKLTLNPVWAQPELLPQVPEAPSTDPGASTDPPTNPEMVSPSSCPPSLSQTISPPARTSEPATAERGPEGKQDAPASECHPQMHSLELRSDPSSALDRVALLPVAEEEESVPEAAQADKQSDQGSKKDSLTPKAKSKKELDLPQGMEAIKENKTQEDGEVSSVTEREVSEDTSDSTKDDRNGPSPNDKEIEAEFHRLSLGFKCDMFTLEKRLRLEERSRDLAEENVRKEVSSCLGLLQALIPRCEEDGLCMEIIQRLQKNLEILMQSMTRVSSRSEMLGAIHQESRTGKAVEVMVHHVENLKRMYTKEHTELTELRESIAQTEKSFGSTERDDFRTKKPPGSQYYKVQSAVRRVSIATMPRSSGGNMNHDPAKDSLETEAERLSRKSPWTMMAKGSQRPQLKRFISSGAWPADEPSLLSRYGNESDSPSEEEPRTQPPAERRSSLTKLGNKITALIMPKTPTPSPSVQSPLVAEPVAAPTVEMRPRMARPTRGPWLWVALVLVLVGLLALLASLVLQPAVDAAPVGTGDSWTTIQQLLWPYTGLRHNGQPPV